MQHKWIFFWVDWMKSKKYVIIKLMSFYVKWYLLSYWHKTRFSTQFENYNYSKHKSLNSRKYFYMHEINWSNMIIRIEICDWGVPFTFTTSKDKSAKILKQCKFYNSRTNTLSGVLWWTRIQKTVDEMKAMANDTTSDEYNK